MEPFEAAGLLMVALIAADMLLNRRRRLHDVRARRRKQDHARHIQEEWDARRP